LIEIYMFYIQNHVKKEIIKTIKSHYTKDIVDKIWTEVQLQYAEFLNYVPINLDRKKKRYN